MDYYGQYKTPKMSSKLIVIELAKIGQVTDVLIISKSIKGACLSVSTRRSNW